MAFHRVDPYVLVGVFLLAVAAFLLCGGGDRMSIQRVIQDPIPFLILLGLILLTVWVWRRFKGQ